MKPVTVINRLTIKPGKMEEFLNAQRGFARALTARPSGLVGNRTYKSIDGTSVVLVSQFESAEAQESIRRDAAFQRQLDTLRAFVEASTPGLYEEVSTTGDFR